MSLYYPLSNQLQEPTQNNIRAWLDNLWTKFQPIEQERWNQSNIDTLFYAGEQSFVNRMFNFNPGVMSYQNYYFNLVQQPVNMVTGYQRQHRKSLMYQAADGADPHTTDQYTRLMANVAQKEGIHEAYSKSCELSAIAGMNLLQPYLDYSGDDPAQGSLKLKVWEYNSFLVDPYFRSPDMSDANFVWCQEFISRQEADARFPGKADKISPMSANQKTSRFYFLPEANYMMSNDLMVLSYVWYKWRHRRKRLYSRKRNQFFDFAKNNENLEQVLYHIEDLEEVTVDSMIWKVAVVLNDQLMFLGDNPLWDGPECPFVPNFWNYDPHLNYQSLRSRSLIFAMRSPQFLFNYKVIQNNDIAAATINSGWKRKIGAVGNEDNLKKSGQGWDILINEDYEMNDVEKIIPSAVPESDLALAQQMADLVYKVAGIDLENWSGQNDKQISSLTMLLKQASNLLVFQKYFDQWDMCLKLVGERLLQVALNNWNDFKVALMIGEDPSPHFYSKIFAKYQTVVQEGLLTPTQRNLQAQQMMDINQSFGREVIPASMIIKDMNIQGKTEILQFLQQQEQKASQMQAEQMAVQHSLDDAKIKELYGKATSHLATARERHGRAESNIGLFEERLSEITQNRAMASKAKMEALEKLVDVIAKYGEIETALKMNELSTLDQNQILDEDREKADAKNMAMANEFKMSILGPGVEGQGEQQQMQPGQEQVNQEQM